MRFGVEEEAAGRNWTGRAFISKALADRAARATFKRDKRRSFAIERYFWDWQNSRDSRFLLRTLPCISSWALQQAQSK